jgi:L-alanine-DL-glutamate epimerase-like enolase superfamily enzyme
LTFAAGLHVAAVAASGFILEYSLGANPMLHELAHEDFPVVDGMIEIPDRPGLGVTIDEAFVDRYRVPAPSA